MNAPRAPLLAVRDVTVRFGRSGSTSAAVDGVGFTLYADQTLAVVGESGSGKSVTALTLLRLLPSPPAVIERGTAVLAARDAGGPARNLLSMSMADLRRVRGGEIAMIFQEPMTSLNPLMTVGEQIAEAVELHSDARGRAARTRAIEAMEQVGIPDPRSRSRSYPHEFSGGMRQRVMIAMALACRPRVLLADEPTTALDVTTQAQILDLIDSLRRTSGMGIVLITHDLGVVARRADVLCVMFAGRVVEYGRTRDLLTSPRHPYTKGLLACRPDPRAVRPRLPTVREAVGRAYERAGGKGSWTAWWPGVEPSDVDHASAASVLIEVEPQRWVRAWAARGDSGLRESDPDVAPVA